jgi:hypothetical protein
MGKTLTKIHQITASQIISRSDVGAIADNANGTLTATDVTVTAVQNALGETSTSVSTLCTSANINKWANFSPYSLGYDSTNEVFTHIAPSAPYKLGDFAGYNHQAETLKGESTDESKYLTTLTGTTGLNSKFELGEYDYTNKQVSGNWMNYMWVKATNAAGSVYSASKAIQADVRRDFVVLDGIEYTIPKKGSTTISVEIFMGHSTMALAKVPVNQTWKLTLMDGNPYFATPIFDKATASGTGFNSSLDYFCGRETSTESIKTDGTYYFKSQIAQRNSDGTISYKYSTTNETYIKYTDGNGTLREELIATNTVYKSDGTLTTLQGTLTYGIKMGDDPIWIIKNAILQ